jgi:GNAT superfamily N-acetyltransferase
MSGTSALTERVWSAHGDAWQAEGRLRQSLGGGAAELPGIRLMASGLPHAQWNNGDVTDPARLDVEAVRAWYAARAGGNGVPWGICVPAGSPFARGRHVFRKRCMALLPERFRAVRASSGVAVGEALPADLATFARIDAAAFAGTVEQTLPWVAPHFGATGFTVALARLDGEPVGVATAIHTDDRAGPSVGIFGVGVLEHARRRGIGGAMTSWLLEMVLAQGATLAHLNPDSEPAARLYARLGFVETEGLDVYCDL